MLAKPLSREPLGHYLGFDFHLNELPARPPLHLLQLLHLGHHRGVHAAELGVPLQERLRPDALLHA
jgi:hypothetical protein